MNPSTSNYNAQTITFGVEIETTIPGTGTDVVRGAYHSGTSDSVSNLPISVDGGFWKATNDSSINANRGRIGVEFVSPVLRGTAGLRNVLDSLKILKASAGSIVNLDNGTTFYGKGARVNESCGFHIHIGLPDDVTIAQIQRIVSFFAAYEDAFYACNGTTRRDFGTFAPKIKRSQHREIMDKSSMDEFLNDGNRYSCGYSRKYAGLNLRPVITGTRNTVEFRLFAGTLNPTKMAAYIQMALALVEFAVASAKRAGQWDQKPASNKFVGVCQAEREFNRFAKRVRWQWATKQGAPFGIIGIGEGFPTIAEMMAEMRGLARKYSGLSPDMVADIRESEQRIRRERRAAARAAAAAVESAPSEPSEPTVPDLALDTPLPGARRSAVDGSWISTSEA